MFCAIFIFHTRSRDIGLYKENCKFESIDYIKNRLRKYLYWVVYSHMV